MTKRDFADPLTNTMFYECLAAYAEYTVQVNQLGQGDPTRMAAAIEAFVERIQHENHQAFSEGHRHCKELALSLIGNMGSRR